MKVEESIKAYHSERGAKVAQMEAIMSKSNDSGETLDEAQSEEYDRLEKEVAAIDTHLERLNKLKATQKLTPVDSTANQKAADDNRAGNVRVSVKDNLPAGVAMARVIKCMGVAKGNLPQAAQIAEVRYKDDARIQNVLKAAVAAGSTTNADWAGNLVSAEGGVYADFVEFLRPQTILGKFGTGNIPSLRRVPFRVPLIGETASGEGYWVGEGNAKPLTSTAFARTTLEPLKVANIAVITEELLRDSSPSADILIRDMLVSALKSRLDVDFIDPSKANVSGISPASITNDVTPIASVGTDAESIRCDIRALFAQFIAANNTPSSGVFVMSAMTAMALSQMTNALGQYEFPGMTMFGGTLAGLPVITSEYITATSDSSGSYVVLLNAQDIYLGDDGGFAVDLSREASLEMDNAPTNASVNGDSNGGPVGTQMVSMFQTNSVAFRAERTISWKKRRVSGVALLNAVNWGACAS